MKAVIAAAGTGGHINPGIAIANKIKKEEPNSEIIFLGTERGLENDLVPRAGYKLVKLNCYGLSRSFSFQSIAKLFHTIGSIGKATKIIKKFNPDIIIGTGGYICVPACMAAQKLKIPYVIHESNALPGKATKMFSKKADRIFVGFEEAEKRFDKNVNVVYTGTPARDIDFKYSKEEINKKKSELGFDINKPLVLVFGGSQGARSINISFTKLIEHNKKLDYEIMWATGKGQYAIVKRELESNHIDIKKIENVKIVPYIYNMDEMMNICDLVVSRSGAMTVTEIEKVGKGAIFIPFPYAAENHQEYNARVLENLGAAKVILDKDLNDKIINETIEDIINDKSKLELMGEIAKSKSVKNVEDKIYSEICECIKDK